MDDSKSMLWIVDSYIVYIVGELLNVASDVVILWASSLLYKSFGVNVYGKSRLIGLGII